MLHMYWNKNEEASLCVTLDDAYVIIDDLHISRTSNSAKPYDLRARGGARLMLTNEQYLTLLAEYTRYTMTCMEPIEFKKEQVGYAFSVVKDGR